MRGDAIVNLTGRSLAAPDATTAVLSGEEVKAMFAPRAAARALGAFRNVDIAVEAHDVILSVRPVVAARLMARGRCGVVDAAGRRTSVGWGYLAGLVTRSLAAAREIRQTREGLTGALARLEAAPPARRRLTKTPPVARAVYVRPDLWIGVKAGGSVGHIAGIVNTFAALGWRPALFTADTVPTVSDAVEVHVERPTPRAWFTPEWPMLAFNRELADRAAARLRAEEVGFVYQRHSLHSFVGALLAERWNAPLALEYNGSEAWIAEKWGSGLKERDLAFRIEAAALANADLVVVVSDVLRRELLERGVPNERILVNPNAVDPHAFGPHVDGAEVRRRHGLEGSYVIGFVGTFGPWHGAELLVEAFAALPRRSTPDGRPIKLLLVGDGARMPQVRAAIASHGLEERVVTTGLVPQADAPRHLAAFDLCVSPTVPNPDGTEFFGSPTKMFEYLASGRPTVTSAIGQMASLVRHEETGLLVAAGDRDALAAALTRLAEDPALGRRLAEAARADVLAHHTHEHRAQAVIDRLRA